MTPAKHLILGMVLTGAAGLVDIVGFIELGGYFTSFMSGNTTQGAAALFNGEYSVLALTLTLIALFFLGSTIATFLATAQTRWSSTLVTGFTALAVAAALGLMVAGIPPEQSLLLLSLAAGAQNAILPARGTVRLGATFVTGTLYVAGQDLALALRGKSPKWRWLQHIAIWFALFGGAALGAWFYSHMGIRTLFIALAVYSAFFLAQTIRANRSRH
ncbi:YoaK family protein [Devosia sp. MC521]|uniref:YoaK family protein n=1 Tax=Devosia sp. MC521 TaxID=2759954 RepID=UPI0015FB5ECC|nr:YoaK family protein [Devosia sp. MC521]MBJ6986195.1 DUF1275 domain-containing protein [Devosia sp. MC521]QMW64320.1 DUF1275 domain-containing protein [Devosia sp. MC521]